MNEVAFFAGIWSVITAVREREGYVFFRLRLLLFPTYVCILRGRVI